MIKKPKFRITLSCIITKGEKVLLGKRSKNEDVLPGLWGLPGGNVKIEGNVQNIFESELKREIKEEIGIEVDDLKYLESHSCNKIINLCFVTNVFSGEPKALDETEEVRWFSYNDIKKLKLTPHTLQRIDFVFKKNGHFSIK